MYDVVTEDWNDFGYREKDMALELLQAWRDGRVATGIELGNHVRAAFNRHSAYVFLTNDEYDAFMLDENNELNIFLSCPECGNEGFPKELYENPHCRECKSFAKNYITDLDDDEDGEGHEGSEDEEEEDEDD